MQISLSRLEGELSFILPGLISSLSTTKVTNINLFRGHCKVRKGMSAVRRKIFIKDFIKSHSSSK